VIQPNKQYPGAVILLDESRQGDSPLYDFYPDESHSDEVHSDGFESVSISSEEQLFDHLARYKKHHVPLIVRFKRLEHLVQKKNQMRKSLLASNKMIKRIKPQSATQQKDTHMQKTQSEPVKLLRNEMIETAGVQEEANKVKLLTNAIETHAESRITSVPSKSDDSEADLKGKSPDFDEQKQGFFAGIFAGLLSTNSVTRERQMLEQK
jgi:hypothetical protein